MPLARDLPTLQHFKASQPRPADALLKGMEFEDRQRRTKTWEDRTEIMRQRFDADMSQFKKNFGHKEKVFEFGSEMKAMNFAAKTAPDQETFNQTVKELTGKDPKVRFMGPDINLKKRGKDG
jgi:hypothetical protein